ncbi:MAG: hypothetical protein ACRDAM_19915, partial [Casimicrobium sp.]
MKKYLALVIVGFIGALHAAEPLPLRYEIRFSTGIYGHACVIHDGGRVRCLANDKSDSSDKNSRNARFSFNPIANIDKALSVATGADHICAALRDGSVRCWGGNRAGQLGSDAEDSETPILVPGIKDAVEVSASYGFSCARMRAGTVQCWGYGADGQIGDGTREKGKAYPPTLVPGVTSAIAIASGPAHTCALQQNGKLLCWGRDDIAVESDKPVELPDVSDVAAMAFGVTSSCVLNKSGKVYCWGEGSLGQLGDGKEKKSETPVEVHGLDDAIQIAAGEGHTCALRKSGKTVCWGFNLSGQVGDGSRDNERTTPVGVLDIEPSIAIGVFQNTSCAATKSNEVVCWGRGMRARDNDDDSKFKTVKLSGIADLSAGSAHTCALLKSGDVSCWGSRAYGRLGDGLAPSPDEPIDPSYAIVKELRDVVQISSGLFHSCARLKDGQVSCWGAGAFGRLGDGANKNSATPVSVKGIQNAVSVSVGSSHSCAALATGAVMCWGAGLKGQLGDGKNATSSVPVQVLKVNDAVEVSVGSEHSCVRHKSGRVSCWG